MSPALTVILISCAMLCYAVYTGHKCAFFSALVLYWLGFSVFLQESDDGRRYKKTKLFR